MSGLSAIRLVPIAVAAASFLAFLPALQAGFVNWDDPSNFLSNHGYRGLGPAQLRWMFTTPLLGHYIPLTWLTFGLNYALGGMDPWGYHLGNLLLHAGNVALFYLVARRLLAAGFGVEAGGEPAIACGAAVSALVFGVHPLRAESVAWITERRDVLCAWFYLLAVLAYMRGVAHGSTVRGRWLAVSLAAFVAALLSKAMAMTLPLTLLLLDTYPLRRWQHGWHPVLREKIPYALVAGVGGAVAVIAVSRGAAWTGYEVYGPGARLAMVAYSFWFYPSRLIWPVDLSPLHELPRHVDPLSGRFAGTLLVVLAVTAILFCLRRSIPAGLTAWLHSAIVLSPVSGVVHAGHQLAHDRYSYLSGLGFALIAGAGLSWTIRRWRHGGLRGWVVGAVAAAAALAIIGWGVGTWRQSKVWLNSETLWRAAVEADPECATCRANLGVVLVRSAAAPAYLGEAEMHLRAAIRLRPDRPDPYHNLGVLLTLQKRYEEAEFVFRTYMRAFPGLPDGPLKFGMLLRDQGREAEAVPHLRRALRVGADPSIVRTELGQTLANHGARLLQSGRAAEAVPLFEEAAAMLPGNALPLRNLGQALVEQGKGREAVAPLRQALALGPRDAAVRYLLVRAHRLAGEPALAEPHLFALRELDPALAVRLEERR